MKSYGDQRISLMSGRGQMSDTSTRRAQKKTQETKDTLACFNPWDGDGTSPPRNYYKPGEAGAFSVQAVNMLLSNLKAAPTKYLMWKLVIIVLQMLES